MSRATGETDDKAESPPPGGTGPARPGWSPWLLVLLLVEVFALAAFRTPEERFYRFAF
jgi:hypothetical protein